MVGHGAGQVLQKAHVRLPRIAPNLGNEEVYAEGRVLVLQIRLDSANLHGGNAIEHDVNQDFAVKPTC